MRSRPPRPARHEPCRRRRSTTFRWHRSRSAPTGRARCRRAAHKPEPSKLSELAWWSSGIVVAMLSMSGNSRDDRVYVFVRAYQARGLKKFVETFAVRRETRARGLFWHADA